jgi:hypothetical protein
MHKGILRSVVLGMSVLSNNSGSVNNNKHLIGNLDVYLAGVHDFDAEDESKMGYIDSRDLPTDALGLLDLSDCYWEHCRVPYRLDVPLEVIRDITDRTFFPRIESTPSVGMKKAYLGDFDCDGLEDDLRVINSFPSYFFEVAPSNITRIQRDERGRVTQEFGVEGYNGIQNIFVYDVCGVN